LFVLRSLLLSLSLSLSPGVHPCSFDRLHSPWLRDWLILHSARIPLSRSRCRVPGV
jgi:hypothetical protein